MWEGENHFIAKMKLKVALMERKAPACLNHTAWRQWVLLRAGSIKESRDVVFTKPV